MNVSETYLERLEQRLEQRVTIIVSDRCIYWDLKNSLIIGPIKECNTDKLPQATSISGIHNNSRTSIRMHQS